MTARSYCCKRDERLSCAICGADVNDNAEELRAEVARLREAVAAAETGYRVAFQRDLQGLRDERDAAREAVTALTAAEGIVQKLHANDFFEDGTLEDGSSWWQMWADAYGLTDSEISYIESLDAAAVTGGE